jgi:hypothetical protein
MTKGEEKNHWNQSPGAKSYFVQEPQRKQLPVESSYSSTIPSYIQYAQDNAATNQRRVGNLRNNVSTTEDNYTTGRVG